MHDSIFSRRHLFPFIIALTLLLSLSACAAHTDAMRSDKNAQILDAFFEQAKKNEAALVAFLHKMPKGGDLHTHPSGATYGETILDNAIAKGLYFDRVTRGFVAKPASPEPGRYYSPDEMRLYFERMGEALDGINMRNQDKQAESGHDHFFMTWTRYGPASTSERDNALDAAKRASMQNVSYLELMISPVISGNTVDIQASRERFAAIQRDIAALADDGNGIVAGFSLALHRNIVPQGWSGRQEDADVYAEWFRPQVRGTLEFARDNADLGIYGVTILSPEDGWVSRVMFDTQMRIIDEEWNRLGGDPASRPKLNLHGGELTLEYSPYETMTNRISDTIRYGHASRIGHGVSIMWENDVYGLLREMKTRGIAVEICLTSNAGILKVSGGSRHPFRLYWDAGVPLALGTDDEGISRSNMTMEFATAATWFDLSYQDMKKLAFNSLEYSFLPGESLFVNGDYNYLKPHADALVSTSAKARLQRKLLDDFTSYEQRMAEDIRMFGK